MEVKFFCPRWGSEDIPWNLFLQKVKAAGFKGIEWFPAAAPPEEITQVLQLLHDYQLDYSIVMAVTPKEPGFEGYIEGLKDQLLLYSQLGIELIRPLFISVQLGREYYTDDQIDSCLDICEAVQNASGIPVFQETHRNKWSYAAHVTAAVLERRPAVRLTLDVSHWFCVSESYLEDQQETVALAIAHTRHLHARVGHTQGSQVPDFEWPTYQEALEAHLHIWDRWIEMNKEGGLEFCTITPEFGPPPYLIEMPGVQNDVRSATSRQWDLNVRMMQLLDRRYNHLRPVE